MKDLKFDYKKTIYVGLAFFLIQMFWQTYDNIIAKILIDKFGLSQGMSGILMALDNVLAIVLLPLFGLLSDKTKSRFGRRTPYIVIGTLVAAFAFVSLSFVDNKQTVLVEQAGIVSEYDLMYEKISSPDGMTKAEWDQIILNDINIESLSKKYRTIITYVENGEIKDRYEDTDIIGVFDHRDISDIYYNYLSMKAWDLTKNNVKNLVWFIGLLFIVLLAMSTFRSPSVALMPDVTPKMFRSRANAIINLMGSAGAIISIGLMTIFGLSSKSYVSYTPAFVATGVLMLVSLALFLFKVNEVKMVKELELDVEKYHLDEHIDEKTHEAIPLTKSEKMSLLFILLSVFFWYIGYNAITSKLSDYAPKMLNMGFTTPLLVAQAAAIVSFIPIGILSSKFGRKRMILFGVALLAVCFGSAFFLTKDTKMLLYPVLAFTGVAWATINVNSFPMAVELATGKDVGKFTGLYYAFSMAAQIITPILSGFLMDEFGRGILFPYATVFVVISFITMLFVKHGDVKIEKKGLLESFDVED
ncbi:MFS transporter [Haploplasma modicum]|uniref:MFS transporter n=1 Tax=Haploplasma modicum TaxID=2150 RepID=UPI00214CB425|nr:MFS transporter [Haploplasma modicum]MCR1809471.1 MFS transporter [Haploplasma modicum]